MGASLKTPCILVNTRQAFRHGVEAIKRARFLVLRYFKYPASLRPSSVLVDVDSGTIGFSVK